MKVLEDEITQNPEESLSIGVIEPANLIELEDTLPTAGYQNVLKQVTTTLQQELRGNDVIGRWADNSFMIILPKTPGPAAVGIFNRISSMLSKPVSVRNMDMSIDLMPLIGGAEYSSDIAPEELLEKAEKALENARKNKTEPVHVWEIKNPFWNSKE